MKRNVELEAAILANREDGAAYDVYADWLQGQGEPLGELIAVQRDIEGRLVDVSRHEHAQKLIAGLGLPSDELATFEWHWGFWRWLRIENSADWMDDSFDAVAAARGLFALLPCAVLAELRLGVLRWGHNHVDVPAVLAEAAKQPWAPSLDALALGDVGPDIDMAHHVIGVVGPAITAGFPRLRSLKLHSGQQSWHGDPSFEIGELALPALQSLTIETCSMSKQRLADVLRAKLPALTELELWFGSAQYGADATLDDLAPLLAGQSFPHLVHLGLRNALFDDELARTIHTSALAPQLEILDLGLGTIDDAAAAELASHAKSFPRLKQLRVQDSFLTPAGVAVLERAFPYVMADSQREPYEEGARYVAVGE